MTIIGIDMSKNSPGVCVRDGQELTFHSFYRARDTGKNKIHFEALRNAGVKMHLYDRFPVPKTEYSESEAWKANDALLYSKFIFSHLPDQIDFLGIEGFSYGSKGNSAIDIVGYGYAVRMAAIEKYGQDKFSVFAPGNVKKMAGKGNAGKEEIFQRFLAESNYSLTSTGYWKGLSTKTLEYLKPVDDLCDAYYVQECAKAYYEKKLSDISSGL
jgi:hypothetical protein